MLRSKVQHFVDAEKNECKVTKKEYFARDVQGDCTWSVDQVIFMQNICWNYYV